MNSDIVVFIGPTISKKEAEDVLEATYLPPVTQGDFFLAYQEHKPKVMAIIDGCFENIPAIWHKEVLFAMAHGVHVFGASSMGALRASELHVFGMVGIGDIFQSYKNGELEDDDEVAVLHGPEELGYPCLSEAMVSIRRTLADARQQGIVSESEFYEIISLAKGLHYKDRNYQSLQKLMASNKVESRGKFMSWLENGGRKDAKKEDALLLLEKLKRMQDEGVSPMQVDYHFEATLFWVESMRHLIETK